MKAPQIVTTTGAGRRALCIGIDSYTRAPLRGAVSDAERWAEALEDRGFHITALHDHEATRARILEGLWIHVADARPGDRIVITFAGHGTHDTARPRDTAIVCADVDHGGIVLDEEIGEVMASIAPGVHVTLFFDCCHSGTISRTVPNDVEEGHPPIDAATIERHMDDHDEGVQEAFARLARFRRPFHRESAAVPRASGRSFVMREVCFSACGDDELAYEIAGKGVFTTAATTLLAQVGGGEWTNRAFLGALEMRMRRMARQRPRLTCEPCAFHAPLLGGTITRRAA